MVQGKTKHLQRKAASSRAQQKKTPPKKGQRHIAPKRAAAIKHMTLQKVRGGLSLSAGSLLTLKNQTLSAKINNSIESQMASASESTGKLHIVKSSAG